MNRRTAIHNTLLFSAGIIFLPSCLQKAKPTISLKNITVTKQQEQLLAQLADTIIPKTNFIGAADLKAHEFLIMMVDDCYPPDKQKVFIDGLQQFDTMVIKKYGQSFINCPQPQQTDCLNTIQKETGIPHEVLQFYHTSKELIIQSFTTSKQYMLGILKYNMVPGPNYRGCVSINKNTA